MVGGGEQLKFGPRRCNNSWNTCVFDKRSLGNLQVTLVCGDSAARTYCKENQCFRSKKLPTIRKPLVCQKHAKTYGKHMFLMTQTTARIDCNLCVGNQRCKRIRNTHVFGDQAWQSSMKTKMHRRCSRCEHLRNTPTFRAGKSVNASTTIGQGMTLLAKQLERLKGHLAYVFRQKAATHIEENEKCVPVQSFAII